MATFIPYSSEEEQYLELSRAFSKLRTKGKEQDEPFFEECSKLATAGQTLELLNKLADDHQTLFSEASSQEIESFFLLAFQPLTKPQANQQQVDQLVSKLVSILIATADDKSLLRLKILGHMYNILEKRAQSRYEIFVAIVKFAGLSKHVDVMLPHLKDVSQKTKEWGINNKQTRELYKTIRNLLKENGRTLEAQKWSVKYLSTFENNFDSEDAAAVQQDAVQAILEAIKFPSVYQFDSFLDLYAVKQLESNAQHAKVFQLLKIFVNDTVDAYNAFVSANSGLVQSLGLNEQETLQKIRLLSLASLGCAQNELSYSQIAKTLHIEESEVEVFVILAITENVVTAKIDQLKGTITVSRALPRVFSRAQWQQLSDTLTNWKANMNVILKTLQDCKQQQAQQILQLQQQQQLEQDGQH